MLIAGLVLFSLSVFDLLSMSRFFRVIFFAWLVPLAGLEAREDDQEGMAYFETHIRPLLAAHCYECHSHEAESLKAHLFLDSRIGWETGGDSGPALVPGKPEESLLMRAVRHESRDLEMPPDGRLPKDALAKLARWIAMGAPDPREGSVTKSRETIDLEKGRQFWAFQPPLPPKRPQVRQSDWPTGPIDQFILARLESEGIPPAAPASRATLLRRVFYDLIGLPPTPEEMSAFLDSSSPQAFAAVVDDLLARPEFGERWGRHWLDVVRFAESSGGGRSMIFPDAWRFRDYVIRSFNEDKPFTRLIREHLAGDLLETSSAREKNEALIGSGFLVLGPMNYELQDHEKLKMEFVDEQIDTVGKAFLGMTLGCARCHDHKFDPIPARDYYALAGIFESTRSMGRGSAASGVTSFATTPLQGPEGPERVAMREEIKALTERLATLKSQDPVPGDEVKNLEKKRKSLQARFKKEEPKAMAASEGDDIVDAHLRIRGEVRNKGPQIPRGFLTVALPTGQSPEIPGDQSGRRQLADWIASPENPLTARVMANRIWQHLLGRGLVRTPDHFGSTGRRPTHPALLDYLALRFIEQGWSVKALIREMVLSRTYRQAAEVDHSRDPENHFFGRAHRKRLEAEAIRDTLLQVSGTLDPKRGGPTLRNPGKYDLNYQFETRRRSVYVPWLRNSMLDLFEVFDAANPNLVTGRRPVTNLPTQSLFLLNSDFIREQARATARGLLEEKATLDSAYQLILCRPPRESERLTSETFLAQFPPAETEEAWTQLCHSLFACLDFRYLD